MKKLPWFILLLFSITCYAQKNSDEIALDMTKIEIKTKIPPDPMPTNPGPPEGLQIFKVSNGKQSREVTIRVPQLIILDSKAMGEKQINAENMQVTRYKVPQWVHAAKGPRRAKSLIVGNVGQLSKITADQLKRSQVKVLLVNLKTKQIVDSTIADSKGNYVLSQFEKSSAPGDKLKVIPQAWMNNALISGNPIPDRLEFCCDDGCFENLPSDQSTISTPDPGPDSKLRPRCIGGGSYLISPDLLDNFAKFDDVVISYPRGNRAESLKSYTISNMKPVSAAMNPTNRQITMVADAVMDGKSVTITMTGFLRKMKPFGKNALAMNVSPCMMPPCPDQPYDPLDPKVNE